MHKKHMADGLICSKLLTFVPSLIFSLLIYSEFYCHINNVMPHSLSIIGVVIYLLLHNEYCQNLTLETQQKFIIHTISEG